MILIRAALLHILIITQFVLDGISGQENVLKNPDFEDPFTAEDWYCAGDCVLERYPDAQSGSFAGKVSNRELSWETVNQNTILDPDSNYYFSAWVKLLNQLPGYMYHKVQLMLAIDYVDGTETEYKPSGNLPYVKEIQGWQKISGDFVMDSRAVSNVRVYLQIPDLQLEFLIDTASLVKVPRDSDWKTKAQERIEQIRKDEITINLVISEDYQPSEIELTLSQKKHDFAFGSAIKHPEIAGSEEDNLKYQACFYENFEWSVPEYGLKWNTMEPERDVIQYPADDAIDALLANGVPVRGHTAFWDKESANPEWLKPLSGSEILQEITKRMDYLIPRYKGKLVHWDVNNEQLHGDFYENKTEDAFITQWLFDQVRERDANVTLFLNDYGIVSYEAETQAIVNSAEELLALGAEVQAIGVQAHMAGVQDLSDITAVQIRLDTVSSANLPIWVTELDIREVTDATQLAQSYEDLWTLFFSQPLMQGILLWGFHDEHHHQPESALFEGPDYEPNESGLRWQTLMRETWRTNAVFQPSQPAETFDVRGFHGLYQIDVIYNEEAIQSQEFYLYPGKPVVVDINVA